MEKICKITGATFTISEKDQAFYDKMQVPYPDICHEERLRRRELFRNVRTLYKRKCDKTGKSIISMYDETAPFPVYHRDEWWKDGWQPPQMEFDFNRPFFEQFKTLRNQCPRASVFNKKAFNSDYCNVSDGLKDCYMSFVAFESRNLIHSHRILESNDLTDCYYCTRVQLSYNCVYCFDCLGLTNCVDCRNCSDSAFLYDCVSCKNCFMCTNLRQKQYYIFNQPYTKEEYEEKMKQINLGSYAMTQYLTKKFEDFRAANAICRSNKMDQCEDCRGHRLLNCKDVIDCIEIEEARDLLRCIEGTNMKDCADSVSFGGTSTIVCELGYELQECVNFYNFKFCNYCYGKSNLEYCDECHNCSDCFGCVGLKNETFRILNKKYEEAEYHALKSRIIEHMKKTGEYGSFFPPELSSFAYNETEAQEYFPLTKEEVQRLGFRWKDDMPTVPGQALSSLDIPDDIKDADKAICKKVFECEISGKKFAITEHELAFYKSRGIALPRRSPQQRHLDRLRERRVPHLYLRQCTKCGADLQSAYPPEFAGKVYCDTCYFAIVY